MVSKSGLYLTLFIVVVSISAGIHCFNGRVIMIILSYTVCSVYIKYKHTKISKSCTQIKLIRNGIYILYNELFLYHTFGIVKMTYY